jgi:hypothetical protein
MSDPETKVTDGLAGYTEFPAQIGHRLAVEKAGDKT